MSELTKLVTKLSYLSDKMHKGKYKPDIVEAIYKAISLTGIDKNGIKAGRISKDTFYRWLRTKSDFSDGVARAKRKFRDKVLKEDHELFLLALEQFKKHLNGTVETWEKIITHRDGKKSYVKTTVKRTGSRWAIEAILFPPLVHDENSNNNTFTQADSDMLIAAMRFMTSQPKDVN